MIINSKLDTIKNRNVAFVINNCEHCAILKATLDNFNINLPLKDKITIINCTRYHDLGIIDHPLIKEYAKALQGVYPSLFIGHQVIRGANTVEELKVFLSVLMQDKMILAPDVYDYTFNKQCQVRKGFLGRNRIICK